MKLFSSQNAELKTMNRVLTDAARKRSERIAQLELQLEQLRQVVAGHEQEAGHNEALHRELSAVREAAAERAVTINKMNQELAAVREDIEKRAVTINNLNQELAAVRASIDNEMYQELIALREDIAKRALIINEKDQQLAGVREATTKYALWAQELDRLLLEIGTRELERRQAWSTHVEPLGVKYRNSDGR